MADKSEEQMTKTDKQHVTGTPPSVDFLLQSYSNTQNIIQFMDTKAGAYIALNGILASLLMNEVLPLLTNLASIDSPMYKYLILGIVSTLGVIFLSSVVLVFYRSFLVLTPRSGSQIVEKGNAIGLFWASDVREYLRTRTIKDFVKAIYKIDERGLINELSFEAAKLAFITTEKQTQLQKATVHFKRAIVMWSVLLAVCAVIRVSMAF